MESPYEPGFVQTFKGNIPSSGRKWLPDRKRWLVSALYIPELLALLRHIDAEVQDDRVTSEGVPVALPPMPPDLKAAFDILHLQYTAPLGAAEAVYKFFARYWHPDVGGTHEDCALLNQAIATIRQYLAPCPVPPVPEEGDHDDDIPF
jgi:hypothetical protein